MTDSRTDTHCPYCALQCAMTLTPEASGVPGRELRVEPRQFPTNGGGLCRKGWTSGELVGHADRLTGPLLRDAGGVLRPVSWDAALDAMAAAFRAAQDAYGRDAVGIFGGASLTNERAYSLGKFARVALRTSRIDYNGRFCMASAATAGNRSFGLDRGMPFPMTDLDEAHTIMLLGSNPAETMPPFVQHLAAARRSGGLLVMDPRRTATAKLTDDGGGLHLQPTPGTDHVVLAAIAHVVILEGLADEDYLEDRTTGYPALARVLRRWWPERAAEVSGVPALRIREAARLLSRERRGTYVLTGRGVEQHVDGTDTTTAAINLALLLGLPGRLGSGYGTFTGQGNGQGAREQGQKADQLPGYRSIADPDARAHVARVWGIAPEDIPGPGLPAVELLGSLGREGGVRALWVNGSNVLVSAPDVNELRAGLRALDFLVVTEFFLSETARLADLVLPVPQWAEESGTMTNLEGRVLRRNPAAPAPEGVRSELWIMRELARRLGAPGVWSDDPRAVFDELRAASAGGRADYSGITNEALDAGVASYWPCPPERAGASEQPGYADGWQGAPRVFLDGFAHPDGRARLVAVTPRVPRPEPGTLTLLTGRYLEHYQSGTQTRRVASLEQARPAAMLQIHPATAMVLGIGDGDLAEVANDRGVLVLAAQWSADIRLDAVFLPFHYGGAEAANALVEPRTDPLSGMPEFKNVPVRVRAYVPSETVAYEEASA